MMTWAHRTSQIATIVSAAVQLVVFSHNWLGPHTWDIRLSDFTSVVFARVSPYPSRPVQTSAANARVVAAVFLDFHLHDKQLIDESLPLPFHSSNLPSTTCLS